MGFPPLRPVVPRSLCLLEWFLLLAANNPEKCQPEGVCHVATLTLQNCEHSGMPDSASTCFCLQIYLGRTFDIHVTQRYNLVSPLVSLPPHSHLPPPPPPTTNTTMHFESPLKFSKCFHIHTPFFMSGQGNILLHLAKGHFETLREKKEIQHDL